VNETEGIELLPEVPPAVSEKVLAGLIKAAVPIAVGVQLLFLLLLGLNLKLDQDLTTLAASVAEKEMALADGEELEDDFRSTQAKLETIAAVKDELCYSCVIQALEEITPPLVTVTTADLTADWSHGGNGRIALAAKTSHGQSFILFVTNLLNEEAIKEAAITSGNLNKEGYFIFSMELLFDKSLVCEYRMEETTQ